MLTWHVQTSRGIVAADGPLAIVCAYVFDCVCSVLAILFTVDGADGLKSGSRCSKEHAKIDSPYNLEP